MEGVRHEVDMRIAQARQDELPTQVHALRSRPSQGEQVGAAADSDDAGLAYGNSLHPWYGRVNGVYARIIKNQVGRVGKACDRRRHIEFLSDWETNINGIGLLGL